MIELTENYDQEWNIEYDKCYNLSTQLADELLHNAIRCATTDRRRNTLTAIREALPKTPVADRWDTSPEYIVEYVAETLGIRAIVVGNHVRLSDGRPDMYTGPWRRVRSHWQHMTIALAQAIGEDARRADEIRRINEQHGWVIDGPTDELGSWARYHGVRLPDHYLAIVIDMLRR